jgi:subfamily B ATP-binding cassette protein MsbA
VKALKRLLPFFKPHRWRLASAVFFMALVALLGVVQPLILKYLYDKVIGARDGLLLLLVVGAAVTAPVVAALIRFVTVRVVMLIGRRLLTDVRLDMYRRVLNAGMRYHSDLSSGAIVGRIMDDVNMLRRLLTAQTVRLVVDAVVFCFSLAAAFSISPRLAGIMCGTLVLYVLAYRFFAGRIAKSTRLYRSIYDEIGGRLQETVSGVRLVRTYNREEEENELFLDRTARSLDRALATGTSSIGLSITCRAIAGYGSTVIMGLGAYYILKGELTFGGLQAIDHYVWMAITPVINLTIMAGQLNETLVSVGRVAEVLEEEPDVTSPPDAPFMKRGPGAVEFRDVHFEYLREQPLYRGLCLKVEPGSMVALVGKTGCGKSTLVSLLMRLWDVKSGTILIDGVDIRTVDLGSLRRLFGVVLQDPLLFDGTIADNIAYGRPDATRAEIEDAARAAEVYETVAGLPGGFDTVLGSKGVRLSVGEKQRISIARAVLTDPEILIMDEATSSLDSESERLIQKSLGRVLQGRTSLIIAHRLSTVTKADMIVVMDRGKIIETGTHEGLMAREESVYRRQYEALLSPPGGASPPGQDGGAS